MRHLRMTQAALGLVLLSPLAFAQQIGPRQRVDAGRGAQPCNETTIGSPASDPLVVVGGWNDYRQGPPRTGVGLSLDGGLTWSDFLLRPPAPNQSNVEGDPMTAFDDRTGTVWAGGISFAGNGGVFAARKDPGSPTFGNAVMAFTGGGPDKGWMAAGPDPAAPDTATLVYIAYNFGVQVSADMGDTWSAPTSLGSGLGFLPRVGPAGELYVGYWDVSDKVRLRRSFDGGATYSPPITIADRMDVWGIDGSRFPGEYRVASLLGLDVDPNTGDLYCVYPDTTDFPGGDANVDVYFTRSSDQGSTWSTPTIVNGDGAPFTGDQFFPWIEVDRQGRLHVVYYDTRFNAQADSAPQGLIDATYAISDDQGATWTEARLTQQSFTSATDGFGGAFVGDYLGLATSGGRTWPLYMDTSPNGNADIFTHVITNDPATTYCYGIGCPCGNDDPDAGCGNAGADGNANTGATLAASGTNVFANDDLVLAVAGMQANQFGLLYTGMNLTETPLGDGRRCVDGPFFRYPAFQANGAGEHAFGPGAVVAGTAGFGAAGQIAIGETWHYQCWFRDPGGPCGSNFNFTNALSVTWQ